MDRVAYTNMTYKQKSYENKPMLASTTYGSSPDGPIVHSQDYYAHNINRGCATVPVPVTGEVTNKSKMNTQINTYYLERQNKNLSDYSSFVNSLNSNIREDQYRTNINNQQYRQDCKDTNYCQRVYHPSLRPDYVSTVQTMGLGLGTQTRDRRDHALAQNRDNPIFTAAQTPTDSVGPAKLNYPQGYDQMGPMPMDMTCHLEMQFRTLTNAEMDQQITTLQQNAQKESSMGQTPIERHTNLQHQTPYNPQADHMNQVLHQMALNLPSQSNTVQATNVMRMPTADPLGFQRPSPSNWGQQTAPMVH